MIQKLKLSDKHNEMLLQMCNRVLRKDGKFFTVNSGDIYWSDSGDYPGKSLHWFEMCAKHLPCKLLKDGSVQRSTYSWLLGSFLMNDKFRGTHPIDFLYNQFKLKHKSYASIKKLTKRVKSA